MIRMHRWAGPAAILGAALSVGCSLAPGSGEFRDRASRVHAETSVDALESDVEAEVEFGKQLAARLLGRFGMVEDEALTRYVNLVGSALALHGQRPELEYRFAVLDTEAVNAYAAPGGYVFLTRGALALMRDEAELAAVLAHEIAHVNQRHIVKELNLRGSEQSTEHGLARLFGASADPARVAFNQALDRAIEILLSDGLKRSDEYEADAVGTMLLASTGYDPLALHRYLQRLEQAHQADTQVLARTHPPHGLRLGALAEIAGSEGLDRMGGARAEPRFVRATARVTARSGS